MSGRGRRMLSFGAVVVLLSGCGAPVVVSDTLSLEPGKAAILQTPDGIRLEVPEGAVPGAATLRVESAPGGAGWEVTVEGAVLTAPLLTTFLRPDSAAPEGAPQPLVGVESAEGVVQPVGDTAVGADGVTVSGRPGHWYAGWWEQVHTALASAPDRAAGAALTLAAPECEQTTRLSEWGTTLEIGDEAGVLACFGQDSKHRFVVRLVNTRPYAVTVERVSQVTRVSDGESVSARIVKEFTAVPGKPVSSKRKADLLAAGESVTYRWAGFAKRTLKIHASPGGYLATAVRDAVTALEPMAPFLRKGWQGTLVKQLSAKQCLGATRRVSIDALTGSADAAQRYAAALTTAVDCLPGLAGKISAPGFEAPIAEGLRWIAGAGQPLVSIAALPAGAAAVAVQQGVPKLETVNVSAYTASTAHKQEIGLSGKGVLIGFITPSKTFGCVISTVFSYPMYGCSYWYGNPKSFEQYRGPAFPGAGVYDCPRRGIIVEWSRPPGPHCDHGVNVTDHPPQKVLPVGKQLVYKDVTCQSLDYGVQCFNRKANHGFFVNDEGYFIW